MLRIVVLLLNIKRWKDYCSGMFEDVDSWMDEYGGVYTANKKRLLRVPNVKRYRIVEGCEETDKGAFEGCEVQECLYVPESCSEQAAKDTFNSMPFTVSNFCQWVEPYMDEVYDVNDYWYHEDKVTTDEFGVEYTNKGRRLLTATRSSLIGKEYRVPDGVLTICDGAFMGINDYLELSVPRSIKVIGDYIFGKEGGKFVIRD